MGCCGNIIRRPRAAELPKLSVASANLLARNSGQPEATQQITTKRIAICGACPHFSKEICHRCGCAVVAKVGKQHERCPAGKW